MIINSIGSFRKKMKKTGSVRLLKDTSSRSIPENFNGPAGGFV